MKLSNTPTNDKANLQARGRKGIKVRVRLPNEALPPGCDLFSRVNYVLGMGDPFHQAVRPGADDHLKCKSVGYST